jgi:integrase
LRPITHISGFEKKPGSVDHQTRQLKWWLKLIGAVLLRNLTPEIICDHRSMLKKERTKRGGPRSNSTVNRYMSALSAALTAAVTEWHWLDKNPIHQIPQLTENRGRDRFLNKEELLRLTKACFESKNRFLLALFLLSVATGIRRSEALRLRWKDIGINCKTAYIAKSKNGEPRTLPLEGPVRDEILKLHSNRRPDSELLFPGKDPNKPMDFRTALEFALNRAGITDFRWHDTRHTAGSYLAMSGVTLAEIADILGQKTIAVAKRYVHHNVEHNREK